MFSPTSRYARLPTATVAVIDRDGTVRDVRYVRRRFLPPPGSSVALVSHTVVEGDRLDNVTARYLGDPTQFWRVCDANVAMNPPDLLQPGVTLLVPVPQA